KLGLFPDPAIREEISSEYLKLGKLTGAEYEAICRGQGMEITGLETPELYIASENSVRMFLNAESQGLCADLREALDALKPRLFSRSLTAWDAQSTAYRHGEMTLLKYAALAAREAARLHISSEGFPVLNQYLNSKTQTTAAVAFEDLLVLHELERLEAAIRTKYYTAQAQMELDVWEHRLDIVDRLLNISVTQEELQEFRTQRARFHSSEWRRFLRNQGAESSSIDEEGDAWDRYLDQADAFYRLAEARSTQFVENLQKAMDREKVSLAVMIAGGFHADQVLAELAKRRLGFVEIKPRLTKTDLVNPYFELLQNRRTPLEKLLEKNQDILALRSRLEDRKFLTQIELVLKPILYHLGPKDPQAIAAYLAANPLVEVTRLPVSQAATLGLSGRKGISVFTTSVRTAGGESLMEVLAPEGQLTGMNMAALEYKNLRSRNQELGIFASRSQLVAFFQASRPGRWVSLGAAGVNLIRRWRGGLSWAEYGKQVWLEPLQNFHITNLLHPLTYLRSQPTLWQNGVPRYTFIWPQIIIFGVLAVVASVNVSLFMGMSMPGLGFGTGASLAGMLFGGMTRLRLKEILRVVGGLPEGLEHAPRLAERYKRTAKLLQLMENTAQFTGVSVAGIFSAMAQLANKYSQVIGEDINWRYLDGLIKRIQTMPADEVPMAAQSLEREVSHLNHVDDEIYKHLLEALAERIPDSLRYNPSVYAITLEKLLSKMERPEEALVISILKAVSEVPKLPIQGVVRLFGEGLAHLGEERTAWVENVSEQLSRRFLKSAAKVAPQILSEINSENLGVHPVSDRFQNSPSFHSDDLRLMKQEINLIEKSDMRFLSVWSKELLQSLRVSQPETREGLINALSVCTGKMTDPATRLEFRAAAMEFLGTNGTPQEVGFAFDRLTQPDDAVVKPLLMKLRDKLITANSMSVGDLVGAMTEGTAKLGSGNNVLAQELGVLSVNRMLELSDEVLVKNTDTINEKLKVNKQINVHFLAGMIEVLSERIKRKGGVAQAKLLTVLLHKGSALDAPRAVPLLKSLVENAVGQSGEAVWAEAAEQCLVKLEQVEDAAVKPELQKLQKMLVPGFKRPANIAVLSALAGGTLRLVTSDPEWIQQTRDTLLKNLPMLTPEEYFVWEWGFEKEALRRSNAGNEFYQALSAELDRHLAVLPELDAVTLTDILHKIQVAQRQGQVFPLHRFGNYLARQLEPEKARGDRSVFIQAWQREMEGFERPD
ncbi:MAG: hypothetical protein HGA76_09225, partial [Candidatus Firestonebacteria bacterium]|nr:hypothetical protein [Candidatus Firestonebacteria bacterium]